jgi:hypothetical protein
MSEIDWDKCSVMIGHTLYTDIIPGIVDANTSLLGQVCSITHECQHIIQYDSERAYLMRYFLSSRYRARKEIEAYICNMEIYHELTGEMIPVFVILDKLESYQLCSKDLRIADEMLKERFNSIRLGGVKNESSKAVITWLTQYQITNKCSIRHRSLTAYSDYQKLLV